MIIEMKPLDTLFFRDSKPFSRGEDTWADTIFPPYPSTVYGALRTAWFKQNIKEFEYLKESKKLNTDDDPTKRLKINSILIKKNDDFLFPLPRDILQSKGKNDEDSEFKRLLLSGEKHLTSAKNIDLLINPYDEIFSYEPFWMSELDLADYLKGDISNFEKLLKRENLFELEPKIGIARERFTRCSKDGNLYRVGMLRLKEGVSIYVDFEGLELAEDFFRLGGEGKFVEVKRIEKKLEIPLPEITNNRFVLYLSTHAIFKEGWLPEWIGENGLERKIHGTSIKVKLLTAAIGKPVYIGGFDIAKGEPKPMYKAVPGGSVYYFEILDGNVDDLKKIHGRSISDVYSEQGFGVCYVGKC